MTNKNFPTLYYETITPLLKKILHDIMENPIFDPFYLVGGTSLSLRLGHRKSVDIDLFTNAPYRSLDFKNFEKYFYDEYDYYDCLDKTELIGFGRSYYVGDSEEDSVKVDLFYHDEIIDPCDVIDGIRLASLPDIISMKVDVVSRGGRKKDFWDLHELLDKYSLSEMLEFHKQRHEYTHDRKQILASFKNFAFADDDMDPICLKGKIWELIKLDFDELVEKLQ